MHDRPPLDESELEIRNLLSPTTSVDRDELLYRCGYEAALAEIQQQPATKLPSEARSHSKTWHGYRLLSIVASVAAIVLACLLWQQTQLTSRQSVALKNQEVLLARVTDNSNAVPTRKTKSEITGAPFTKTIKPRNGLPNWLGRNALQQRPSLLDKFESWPSDQPLTIAMNKPPANAIQPPPVTSQPYSPRPRKTRQQLTEELLKFPLN